MKGTALLLLCAATLAQAEQPQLTLSGKVCNCNPSEAANICSQNGSEGELVVHENCNQFYKCSHGSAIPYYCPDILLYSPLAEICDWPENVECGNRPIVAPGTEEDCSEENSNNENQDNNNNSGSEDSNNGNNGGTCNCNPGEAPALCAAEGSDGVLVAHQNCNQFYMCDHGAPVVINCPSGLMYNPYTEQCDWAYNVECGDKPVVEIEGNNNGGDEDCPNGGNGGGDSEDGGNGDNGGSGDNGGGDNTGTCNCNPEEAPGICSAVGSDGTLVAHENCNQFYKCNHGVPITMSCPHGLVYNPYIECCDWPANVDCGGKPIIEIEGGNGDNGSGDNGSGGGNGDTGTGGGNGDNGTGSGTCNCNPGEAPGICAADGSDGTVIAHENCNQFYKCAHGVPVTMNCPPGLVHNPYIECCDWPANVDCGDKPIVEIESGGNGNGGGDDGNGGSSGGDSGSDGNSNENTGTCNCNPGEAPTICSADGSEGILIAHENCNQFYKCSHGVPVTMNCPGNLLYNPYIERCDWPDSVECGDRPIVEIEGGGNGGDSGSGDNGGSDNGGGDNGSGGTCNCNPGEAPGICAADGSEGVLIAHENCNQFYQCSHGVPITMNCPGNLLYNPYIERCDWSDSVECGDRPIVEIEGGGNGGDNGGGDNGGSDNGGGDNGSGGTCNCNPGEAPGICAADGSEGVLIAHENCNQFYQCSHGVPVTMNCPGNLLYNPYIERCDWPDSVECGDRPIVEIEEGGNGGDSGSGDNGGSDNGGGDNGSGGTCNCNPGEAPGICAADGSEGVLIAHENCNQFYQCSHGVPVTMNCPGNLLYNPYIERCDWSDSVECGDRPIVEIEGGGNGGDNGGGDNGGSDNGGGDNGSGGTCNCNPGEAPGICAADGSEGVLIAHENCNQFYQCSHGVPVTMNCPGNLLYNPYIERCDWPDSVECGDRPIVEIEEGGNGGDSGSGDNGGSDNGGGDNGSGGTCNCNPGEAPGICAADGSEGVLIAHENCNQFYQCSHGVPVTMNCPGNLLYNPYIERCDWPDSVECGDRPIVEIEEGGNGGDNGGGDNGGGDNGGGDNGGGDNGGGDNGSGGTCNCNPGEAPGICAADGSEGVLIAHENCNQFYQCSHGVPVTMNCPGNLLYNPYIERCDWPDSVECGDRPIVEIEEGGNGGDSGSGDNGGSDNGGGDNGSGGTCNCNPGEAPGICAADGSEGVLIAHENCNQFYQCSHGVPVTMNCPGNLLYNPYIERCDWPDSVECGDRPIVEIEEGGNGGDNGGGDNGGGDNGGGDNGSGGTCNCNPGEAPGICAADGSESVLIAHENCNQFYQCSHGVPVTLNCPGNLLYNPYIERCDWPDSVECGDRPIVEIEEGGNGGDSGSGDNGGNDNGGGDNGSGGTCNCNPGEAPGICAADGSEGVLIAHENCNQFYQCSHGVPVTMNCPGNLLYNPYIERCDWPDSVECGDRPIVEIEEGGNGGDNGGGDNGGGDNGGGDNGGGDNGSGGTCNCNPGEAPGICAADGSEGVLIAHENCNQFYQCSHGVPVTMNCPGNLLYNPYIERCDWPDSVECGDRPIVEIEGGGNGGDSGSGDNGGSDNGGGDIGSGGTCNCNPGEAPGICAADGSEGVLIAHENCNQFYQCSHGVPITMNCPGNLLYNPYIERCDWPDSVECGDRPIVEIEEGGNGGDNGGGDNGGGDNGGGDNGGGDNGSGGTCNCNPGEAPGICAVDGSEGVLIAHENCKQFYTCSNGLPVALSCPGILLYNPHIERCDWPEAVECGDRPIVEIEEGGSGGGGDNGGSGDNGGGDNEGDNENGGTCNCNPGEAPTICAASGSDGYLIAHEHCNQFYKCSNGLPVPMKCPGILLYNPYLEVCDWPAVVECGDRPIVETDTEKDNVSVEEDKESDSNIGDTCDPSQAPTICATTGSDGVLVAHENCNQFYKCAEGLPVVLDCPPNLFYNSVLQVCDWPANVDCGDRVSTPAPAPQPEEENNGSGDNNESGGNNGGNGDPSEAPAICAKSDSNGVLVAHENCDQFYVCSYGQPVTLDCPSNLLYNPASEECDWPRNVDCGDRIIPEAVPEPESGSPCSCNAREAPAICAVSNSNGKLIAHENCNQYYVCFNGAPVARSCPLSLFYEPHTEQCLWPASVSCEGRAITAYSSLNKHRDARRGFF